MNAKAAFENLHRKLLFQVEQTRERRDYWRNVTPSAHTVAYALQHDTIADTLATLAELVKETLNETE